MNDITISTTADGRLAVASPYLQEFVDAANNLGGEFDRPSTRWLFDPRDEQRVRSLLIAVYGTDGNAVTETVTVQIDLAVFRGTDYDKVIFAGREIARRPARDTRVRLHGATVVEGGFDRSGGSVKNPALDFQGSRGIPGRTVLEVRDVPAGHGDVTAKGVTVVGRDVHREALVAERAALVARLAEIDSLLNES